MENFLTDLARVGRRINRVTFVFNDADGSERGFVQLIPRPRNEMRLHRLWVLKTGQGAGSMILRTLCELADRHGIEISLKATPFGVKPYPMSRDQLADWYRRHGFEGGRWKLARKPRGRHLIADNVAAKS